MQILTPMLRRLRRNALRPVIVDDQRTWRGIDVLVASYHLAREIERTTDAKHIGFMLPTSGLSPVALIATWMLGRTAVPLNYLLKGEDLAYVCQDAGLDCCITVGPMLEHFGPLPEGVNALRLDQMSFKGIPPLRRAVKRPDDHLAALLYTSGTSGKPKGVMLTTGNLVANVAQCTNCAQFDHRDIFVGVLPQFHSFGLTVLTVLPLSIGAKVVYTARFMPKRILSLLSEHRPTVLLAIPSMYAALLAARSAAAEQFESLRFVVSGAEPLPESVSNGFREKLNVVINEGYGLTETAPVTNLCRPEEYRRRSVGPPVPGVDEKIVDPDGRELPPNTDGEILIRGANVMAGYYGLEAETKAVFTEDGYFRTGDMGRFDDDGHLYITGRIKEMLIIGGENVFPREIEEVLNAHPSVHASAVIGVHDDTRGEVPLAFVELEEDATFDETSLRSTCREALAQYKVPREIRVLEALPRNPTGKILRRALSADTPGISA